MKYLLLLLAFCGSARAAVLTDYFIHVLPGQRAGMLVWEDTRERTSQWVAYPNGDVAWGDPNKWQPSLEHMRVLDGYLTISGFDQWSADCIQAEIEDIQSGIRYPVTCRGGHYYSPMLVPRDPWRIRVWGLIAGTRKFYWEADFWQTQAAFNPCWYEGAQSRDAITQQEVWWDEIGGWQRGTGDRAFDAQGKPVRPTVTKLWEITLARGAGPWTILDKSSGRRICAYSMWNWK